MKVQILVGTTLLVLLVAAGYSQRIQLKQPQLSAEGSEPLPLAGALSDNEIIQHVFEGLFAENNLSGPYMIKYCFDEATSHRIVEFVNDALRKAAKGSVTDLLALINLTKEFAGTIPQETIDCLGRNQQITTLGFKYNIDGSTDFQALEIHVITYITLHFLEVHRWAVDLNDKWSAQQYNSFGFAAGGYGHKLFNF